MRTAWCRHVSFLLVCNHIAIEVRLLVYHLLSRAQLDTPNGPAAKVPEACSAAALFRASQRQYVYAGITSLWKGVTPAMTRGLVYGGLRLGLYTPIKDMVGVSNGRNDAWDFYKRSTAGLLSGALAAGITNPTELVRCMSVACTPRRLFLRFMCMYKQHTPRSVTASASCMSTHANSASWPVSCHAGNQVHQQCRSKRACKRTAARTHPAPP